MKTKSGLFPLFVSKIFSRKSISHGPTNIRSTTENICFQMLFARPTSEPSNRQYSIKHYIVEISLRTLQWQPKYPPSGSTFEPI